MADKKVDKAEEQVDKAVAEETDRGFRGVEVDQTPNSAYTVQGQLGGEKVPEAAADPVAARREASKAK